MTARVSWLSLTPVKALALEQVEEVEIVETGIRGDRRFFLVDEDDRLINNKNHGPLQRAHARFDEESRSLTLRFEDGSAVSGEAVAGDEIVTRFFSRTKTARLVPGPWDDALSELAGLGVRLVEPSLSAVDRGREGATTLLGESSLGAIAEALGVATIDRRRFRMNIGIEGLEPHEEDAWLDRRVRVGDAVVVPQGNVGRCVTTTLDPETGIRDLDTLRALADYRGDIETTEPLPFGVHAAVAEPGRVRLGDRVELV